MSAPEPALQLTRAAERDLEEIAMYTELTWGGAQHARYRGAIDTAFETLREFPHVGRPREDIFPGCRGLRVEHHVIYYDQPDPTTIVVRRILHQRQDASTAMSDPGP